MSVKLNLPTFQEAMKRQPQMTAPLSGMTVWRYGSGQFPDVVYWLMLEPDLLDALAADSRKLDRSTREKLKEIVFTRKPRGLGKPKPKKGSAAKKGG